MDMGMGDMSGSDGMGDMGLSSDGVDFSNMTQAMDFLSDLLDDDDLKVIGNDYARYFWYGICVVVALATIKALHRRFTTWLRLRDAAQGRPNPSRPVTLPARWIATVTAIMREASYAQYNPKLSLPWLRVPPMGTVLLLLSYLGFVLALEFINNDVAGAQYWQALGIRAGWLAVAQVPLIILLSMKNNLLTLFSGVSHERLNVLHRWSSRILLLMTIFHFGFQSHGWQLYGLMQLEWATDSCPPTGIAAFAILLWMNLSTLAPFRSWSYEFFVMQHIVVFFGFIIAVMIHLPTTALWSRIYIYIPIALYLLDRIARTLLFAFNNMRVSRAVLTPLDGSVTKIRMSNKAVRKWRPGAHVLLSIPRFGFLQSHPATIVSTPTSHNGDLVFLLKTHKGFTKRILNGANDSTTALLPQIQPSSQNNQQSEIRTHTAFIDGPYGGLQSDFAVFHSVLLIAGSTGCTFTLALLQNLAERATIATSPGPTRSALPVRKVHFLWCVKDTTWTKWIRDELETARATLTRAGVEIQVSVYVTCAEMFTAANDPAPVGMSCPCAAEKGEDKPCCCTVVADDSDEDTTSIDPDDITPTHESPKTLEPISRPAITISEKPLSATPFSSISSLQTPLLSSSSAKKLALLPCATFYSGRPTLRHLVNTTLESATGESGIAVCGPPGLNAEMRNVVVGISDERAIHKGTGAQGCYLHVEGFA